MTWVDAVITEIRQEGDSCTLWLDCPANAIPAAGQYVQAHPLSDADAPLAVTLFPVEIGTTGFRAILPPLPSVGFGWWRAGELVSLRGPLGHGFEPPSHLRHLLLVAAAETTYRLCPLIAAAQAQNMDIVLCTDLPTATLPASIEIYPLQSLPEILPWADYLALDLPLTELPNLRARLGLPAQFIFPCPAQALILAAMPCGALADCGACAILTRNNHKLICKDGPVFDLRDLRW
jgi:dihydroorotate dehydrogenase electron transfer subunit